MKAFFFFILFFLLIGFLIYCQNTYEGFESSCSSHRKLLPINNPFYNLREICKNSILLEDHLFQTKKRCNDCIKKHFLTIEALAEEAITLDKNKECQKFYSLPDKIRKIQKAFITNKNYHQTAQDMRNIRKSLMGICFDQF